MIRRLEIRDFVLIEHLDLAFEAGFGALTGETGAGKSILLDAVTFVLGARADANWVRTGAQRAEVVLTCDWPEQPEAASLLAEWEIAPDDEAMLLIRRTLDANGRSRAWIQGVAVTQSQLRALGAWLADVHGQHAHHALLTPETQRRLVDRFAEAVPEAEAVARAWQAWQQAKNGLDEAIATQGRIAEERERLTWWLREWQPIAFTAEEWQAWEAEYRRLSHAAELQQQVAVALDLLDRDPDGALVAVSRAIRALREVETFHAAIAEPLSLLAAAEAELDEAAASLKRELARFEEDPERLAFLHERISAAHELARKHRVLPEALPALAAEWEKRLAALDAASDLERLQTAERAAHQAYRDAAARLSAKRQKGARRLRDAVMRLLPELAMPHARFEVALESNEPSVHGMERIAFRFAANPGQPPAALAQVASGGELSRIGLAIQVASVGAEAIPTVIFDEVDVGIGGAVAAVVGRLMQQLGTWRQVLAVTHQPQVAACADWHWRVSKRPDSEQSVVTVVEPLAIDARIDELARMVGGAQVDEAARTHACSLLAMSQRGAQDAKG